VEVNQKLRLFHQIFSPEMSGRLQDFKIFPSFAVDSNLYDQFKAKVSDSELQNLYRLSRLIIEHEVKVTSHAEQLVDRAWEVLFKFYNLEEGKVYENVSEFSKKSLFARLLGKK
jgi:hypothetical protein